MPRTLSDYKTLLNAKLNQASLSMTGSTLDATVKAALDALLLRMRFKEMAKTSPLTPFFNDVAAYAAPSDLKGDDILIIRPYMSGDRRGDFATVRQQSVSFDADTLFDSGCGRFSLEYGEGSRILRAVAPIGSKASDSSLHLCEGYDSDGTWVGSLDAVNVRTDDGTFTQGGGSVAFDADVSASVSHEAEVSVSDMEAKDISGVHVGKSYVFADVYLPTASVSSVTLRWGTDAANRFSKAVTANFDGSAFREGWNTLGFAYGSATETGTVDTADIRHISLSVAYPAGTTDKTGFRLDNVWLRDGSLYEVRYYSRNAVKSAAGTYKPNFTADDDVLVCDEEGEAVFLEWLAGYASPNVKDSSGATWMQYAVDSIRTYKRSYPDQRHPVSRLTRSDV